jgi:hypothetical protein|uniref:Transmembrane protein n=1 Tax=Zea mays TaxID=4577 RepID=A0A804R2W7_MAIZE
MRRKFHFPLLTSTTRFLAFSFSFCGPIYLWIFFPPFLSPQCRMLMPKPSFSPAHTALSLEKKIPATPLLILLGFFFICCVRFLFRVLISLFSVSSGDRIYLTSARSSICWLALGFFSWDNITYRPFSGLLLACEPFVHVPGSQPWWPASTPAPSVFSLPARTVPARLLPAGHLQFAGARPARSSSSSHGGARLFLSADRAAHLPTSLAPLARGASPRQRPVSSWPERPLLGVPRCSPGKLFPFLLAATSSRAALDSPAEPQLPVLLARACAPRSDSVSLALACLVVEFQKSRRRLLACARFQSPTPCSSSSDFPP